jgi:hypothetical protein
MGEKYVRETSKRGRIMLEESGGEREGERGRHIVTKMTLTVDRDP